MSRPGSTRLSSSPERSRVLVDVLKELAVQRSLISELLREETEATQQPRKAQNESSLSLRRRNLISPTPDRDNEDAHQPVLSPTSEAGSVDSAAPADHVVTHLMEALSTSSWSSERTLDETDNAGPNVSSAARGTSLGSCSPAPDGKNCDFKRGVISSNRFFVAALQIVEEEYDLRQGIVLEEVIAFTEISSAFLGTLHAVHSTPKYL